MSLSFYFEPFKRYHFLGPNETYVDEGAQIADPEIGEEVLSHPVYFGWICIISDKGRDVKPNITASDLHNTNNNGDH